VSFASGRDSRKSRSMPSGGASRPSTEASVGQPLGGDAARLETPTEPICSDRKLAGRERSISEFHVGGDHLAGKASLPDQDRRGQGLKLRWRPHRPDRLVLGERMRWLQRPQLRRDRDRPRSGPWMAKSACGRNRRHDFERCSVLHETQPQIIRLPNGMAQAQRRGRGDATNIIAPLLETRRIPSAAEPLSPAADVRRSF
jgi:hypothetical protein